MCRRGPRWAWGLAGLASGLMVACQKPEPPPAAYFGSTLVRADLGISDPVSCPVTGYVLLEESGSQGRFPTALAVAELVPAQDDSAAADGSFRGWRIGTVKPEQATYWNSVCDTVPDVREVVILDEISVDKPTSSVADIIAAARKADARLCLIWGPTHAGPLHAALVGLIVDVERSQPVALLQADAGPEDFKKPPPDRFENDRRHEDVNYLVARKLDLQVKTCVAELVRRDERVATTQPSPWRGATTLPGDQPAVPVYIVPNRPIGY